MICPTRVGEQSVDCLRPFVRRLVSEKGCDFFSGRDEPDGVERHTPEKCGVIDDGGGFCVAEFVRDKLVDRFCSGGRCVLSGEVVAHRPIRVFRRIAATLAVDRLNAIALLFGECAKFSDAFAGAEQCPIACTFCPDCDLARLGAQSFPADPAFHDDDMRLSVACHGCQRLAMAWRQQWKFFHELKSRLIRNRLVVGAALFCYGGLCQNATVNREPCARVRAKKQFVLAGW